MKIAVFSGNRAEWGNLEPVVAAIPSCLVIAAHAVPANIHVPLQATRTLAETPTAIGQAVIAISGALDKLQPDILVVYGDRSESFAATIAATQRGIPVAHIEGGDVTEGGCLDDRVRHAMTELASIHFATNAQSAARLARPNVHVVGLPVLDGVVSNPEDLKRRYALSGAPLVVFSVHPVAGIGGAEEVAQVIAWCGDMDTIVIGPNGDAGSDEIRKAYVAHGVDWYGTIPRADYHGLLSIAACVVGNSSAGIKEAPAFGCPCVNVGDRQKGRLRGANVIDVENECGPIYARIQRCIDRPEWRESLKTADNPYGMRGASKKIAEILSTFDIKRRAA